MTEKITVDATGFSCPQPALMTRQALLKQGRGIVEVLVDTAAARENATRTAENLGWKVTHKEQPGGNYLLVMEK
jgi:TusA-related sulfurtransferase